MTFLFSHNLLFVHQDEKHQGTVAFSSIFYWCKYSRHIIKQKELNTKIHPKFYENIERSSCIDFVASNCNQQLVRLFTLAEGVISYLFLHNQCIYISTKPTNDHEYLIKILAKSMNAVKLLIGSDQQQDHSLKSTIITIGYRSGTAVNEYYHRASVWNCEKENPVHFLTQKLSKMNLDLNSKNHTVFSKQSRFYQKLSPFNILSPFFNALDDNEWKHKLDCHLSGSLNTEIVPNFPLYTAIDFQQCREQLDSCMMWWEQPQNWYYVFPILRKLIVKFNLQTESVSN